MFATKSRPTRHHPVLAVNNIKLYHHHKFSASVFPDTLGGYTAAVSVQFYNLQGSLYCSKIIYRKTCMFATTAGYRAESERNRFEKFDAQGLYIDAVASEQNRLINNA